VTLAYAVLAFVIAAALLITAIRIAVSREIRRRGTQLPREDDE